MSASIEQRCSCGATIAVRYSASDDYSLRAKREAATREREDALKRLDKWDRAHKACGPPTVTHNGAPAVASPA